MQRRYPEDRNESVQVSDSMANYELQYPYLKFMLESVSELDEEFSPVI